MKITVSVAEILFDMADRSHNELAVIDSAEARYAYEAGTDKKDELFSLLSNSVSQLHIALQRFCIDPPDIITEGDDSIKMDASTFITFNLKDSTRRRQEQVESAARLVHTYLVDRTLSAFYQTKVSTATNQYGNSVAGVAERIAQTHAQEAAAALASVMSYLYTKLRPVRTVKAPNSDTL